MRPDDESKDAPRDDDVADEAGEHEAPPPATWAARQRAEKPEDEGEREAAEAPEEGEPQESSEESRAGFTEEFDEIQRDLDEELDALEDEHGGEPEEADAEPKAQEAGEPVSQATVETNTLELSDREEAQEAALAGLRARAAKGEAELPDRAAEEEDAETPEPQGGAPSAPPPALAAAVEEGRRPPRAKPVWARFLAASVLIVISMAAATSISLLVYLTDIAKGLGDNDRLANLQEQLEFADGGAPQTILILGSDKRLDMKGDPGRSDTTIVLRVDPNQNRIALLSIPRDLKVNIPGVGVDKFNAAYTYGGPKLTLRVVKQLLGVDVNHVVNINFTGFADAVNAIGCVYVDVDRHYYIPPDSGTAEINIEAGYQRLCGLKALQYVRYRHTDTDLVRAARQQDFLREARQKLPPGTLIRDRNELLDIFTEYTTSDITDGVQLLELLKTFLGVQSAPVYEVHFPADLGDGTSGYVTASQEAIKNAVNELMAAQGTPGERPGGESSKPVEEEKPEDNGGSGGKEDPGDNDHFVGPKMQDSTAEGQAFAHQVSVKKKKDGDPMVTFPIYYPTRLVPGSVLARDSRAFPIDAPDKDVYYGYRMVAQYQGPGGFLEYYGVSGTDWVDAPILDNPSEIREIDGKEYDLFYDGDRLRLVGWKTKNAAYWVNNTLLQSLDERELLSVATSMREYHG
ncbi:MAG TPA: LCP family protein [Solirubrobacterales bacterium]|nr:LCP family protein [Solirubrobacterales bacterium]